MFLGFPLVVSWIGLIEFGLPFLLYMVWFVRWIYSGKGFSNYFDTIYALFPPVSLFIVIFFRDVGGGGNFTMRGIIPAQIHILFSALNLLESATL
jgi:hypothetical protein